MYCRDGTRLAGDASKATETGKNYDKFVIFACFVVNPGRMTFCVTTDFRFATDLS